MTQAVTIPWERLSPSQLKALTEAFILREGTDYGRKELEFETKVNRLIHLVKRGEAFITFDPTDQSFNIVGERIPD